MKIRKIIICVLCITLLLGLCGCRKRLHNLPSEDLMLKYTLYYGGLASTDHDFFAGTLYTVSYDGVVINYDIYGDRTIKEKSSRVMDSSQVVKLYDFLNDNEVVEYDDSLVCDAPTHIIEFYDVYGEEIFTFTGMTSEAYLTELTSYLTEDHSKKDGILLEISYVEVAPTPDRDDVWESSNWVIFYDGTVKYHDEYKGGSGEIKQSKLSYEQIEALQSYLKNNEIVEGELVPCDIPLYSIKHYDKNGVLQTDFWGIPQSEFTNLIFSFVNKTE